MGDHHPLIKEFLKSDAKDWVYIAEGAMNMAFRYRGNGSSRAPSLEGFVLRLRKKTTENVDHESSNPWIQSISYEENVIIPLLGREYIPESHMVPLKPDFVRELSILTEPLRPLKRKDHHIDISITVGYLMVDHTSLLSQKINPSSSKSICFEIKCKCGFLPSSHWITKEIKKSVVRFTMHQYEKLQEGKISQISHYSPLDLFSKEQSRVEKALLNLIQVPQNNLRMFVNGSLAFPDISGDHGGLDTLQNVFDSLNLGDSKRVLNALCQIIVHDPLFDRIKQAQMLDEYDIEGLYPIYQDFVSKGHSFPEFYSKDIIEEGSGFAPKLEFLKSPDEQLRAIQRFLISCTLKDCSVMICLREQIKQSSLSIAAATTTRVFDGARFITENFHGYSYAIAAVDLDPKSFAKIPKYYKEDSKIATLYESIHSDI